MKCQFDIYLKNRPEELLETQKYSLESNLNDLHCIFPREVTPTNCLYGCLMDLEVLIKAAFDLTGKENERRKHCYYSNMSNTVISLGLDPFLLHTRSNTNQLFIRECLMDPEVLIKPHLI